MRLPGHSRRYLIRSCVESKLFCESRTQRLEREAEKGPTTTTDPPPLPPPPPHGAQLLNTKVDPRKRRRGGEEKKKKKGRRRRKKFSKGKGKKVGESPLPLSLTSLSSSSLFPTPAPYPRYPSEEEQGTEREDRRNFLHPSPNFFCLSPSFHTAHPAAPCDECTRGCRVRKRGGGR